MSRTSLLSAQLICIQYKNMFSDFKRIRSAIVVIVFFFCVSGNTVVCDSFGSLNSTCDLDKPNISNCSILQKILNPNIYDKNERPGKNGSGNCDPVRVEVSLMLRNVDNIDDFKMEYSVQLSFREHWIDERLKYSHLDPGNKIKYLQLLSPEKVWVPDVFFANEKTGALHNLMFPNVFVRIFPDGQMLTSYRITLLLACPMDLSRFPLDKQTCPIRMTSYGWTTSDVILAWKKLSSSNTPMMQVYDFKLPHFTLTDHRMVSCTSTTMTGDYGCIELLLDFERQFGYYLIQNFAPSVMLVLVSWVSFWLEPTATEARVSLAITTILAIVTQTVGITRNIPPASYIKSIDIWNIMVQFLVFAVVLEFSYVNYLIRFQWKKAIVAEGLEKDYDEEMRIQRTKELRKLSEKNATRVDNFCKVVFLIVFGIFNAIYWTIYYLC